MVLYLAGPMTGLPRWNFDTFGKAARVLRSAGFGVLSPAERMVEAGFSPDDPRAEGFDLRAVLAEDIAAVLACDGVALIDGWDASPGAVVEVLTAEGANLPWRTVCAWADDAEALLAPAV